METLATIVNLALLAQANDDLLTACITVSSAFPAASPGRDTLGDLHPHDGRDEIAGRMLGALGVIGMGQSEGWTIARVARENISFARA